MKGTAHKAIFVFCFLLASVSRAEGGAGEVLQGLAAMTAAASAAVVPAIQASADVSIAKTNSAAQLQMSQINNDTTKYLADSQERISMFQSLVAMDINKENNFAQTQRLGMMLAEQAAGRSMQYQLESERRKEETRLNMLRIRLADKAADENFKLEKMKLEMMKVQAGLSTGFSTVKSGITKTGLTATSTVPSVSSQKTESSYAFSSRGRGRLALRLRARAKGMVADRLSGLGNSLAMGSTRTFRQKGVSDLSEFQSTVAQSRSIASDEGLYRHVSRTEEEKPTHSGTSSAN